MNRYVEFPFTAYHNYWEIAFFWRNSKSKKGNNSNKMLDGVVFSCQQIGVNTFYKCIEFQVNSFDYWEISIIIWNRHGHECSLIWKLSGNFIKKCRNILGRDILGTTFFWAKSSLIQSSCRSFIRVIVPYEISKVNFRVETKILVSMSEEI